MPERLIGIDIGGSKIAVGLVDPFTGELLASTRGATPKGGNDVILESVGNLVAGLIQDFPEPIDGIGVGIPGNVDREAGVALSAGNLDFHHMPVKTYLQSRFGIETYLENDANAAVLAEKWFGWGRGIRNFICLVIGTGIGGGFVLNGDLYLGKGFAGEIGHMIVDPTKPMCYCRMPGCLESLASGTAIAKLAVNRLTAGGSSSLKNVMEEKGAVRAEDVVQAAMEGDALALDIMEEVGRYLAYALCSLVRLLDPQVIILGGGVSQAKELLLDVILKGTPTEKMKKTLQEMIRFSSFHSGIIGAASVVLENRK